MYYHMCKATILSVMLGMAVFLGNAHAKQVWSDDYDEYVDSSFSGHVICKRPVSYVERDGDDLVWNEDYDEYVPINMTEMVIIGRSKPGIRTPHEVYSEEYEEYVESDMEEFSLKTEEYCHRKN